MDAMLLLEGERLLRVYEGFKKVYEEEDRGLTLLEFVSIFIANVEPGVIETHALVRMLIDLFRQIDINGDQSLEWSEFTSFCIEAGIAAGLSRIPRPAFYFAYDPKFVDMVSKSPVMQQLTYHPYIDCIVTVESESKHVKFFDSKLRLLRSLDTATSIRKHLRHLDTAMPLRHVIIRPQRLVAVLMTNLTIPLWTISARSFIFCGTIHRPDASLSPCLLHYDEASKLLLVGCSDGTMLGYDPDARRLMQQVRVHTDIMMSIISIPQRSGIATSALDHRVLLWDMDRCKVTRELDANGAPIEKLLNVRPLDLLLGLSVSGELIGWDLGMGEKCLVLNGHATKVVDIALVGMVPPRAVTMDSGGNVKLWELSARSGLSCPCIISFAVERLEGFQSTLCTMTAPQRLRGAKTQMWMAEQEASLAEEHEHDSLGSAFVGDLIIAAPRLHRVTSYPLELAEPATAALYNHELDQFCTAMPREVRLWDAETSDRLDTFDAGAGAAEATSACFDDRQRKLFIGCSDGRVLAMNLVNGTIMKTGQVCTGAIAHLIYNKPDRCIIAGSRDGCLAVFDDEPQMALDDLRVVQHAHSSDITAMAFSYELSQIVTGDRHGELRAWDFQDLKLMGKMRVSTAGITAVICTKDVPFIIAADGDGSIHMLTSRGHLAPYQHVFSFSNLHIIPEIYDPEDDARFSTPRLDTFAPVVGSTAASSAAGSAAVSRVGSASIRFAADGSAAVAGLGSARRGSSASSAASPTAAADGNPKWIRGASLHGSRRRIAVGLSDAEASRVMVALEKGARLAALVEQVLDEHAAKLSSEAGVFELGSFRRSRKFKLSYSKEDFDDLVPDRTAAYAARLKRRDRSVPVAVTALSLAACEMSAMGAVTRLECLASDDRGYMQLFDLTSAFRKMTAEAVPDHKWPSRTGSYDPHRRVHRAEAGPIITDELWFYTDSEVDEAKTSITKAEADKLLELHMLQRTKASASPARGGKAASKSPSRSPSPRAKGGSSPALLPSIGKAGRSMAAPPAISPRDGLIPKAQAAAMAAMGGAGTGSPPPSASRRPGSGSRSATAFANGMTVRMHGLTGVSITSSSGHRSSASNMIMLRNALEAGVSNVVSDNLLTSVRHRRPSTGSSKHGDDASRPASANTTLATPSRSGARLRVKPPSDLGRGDAKVVRRWQAHQSAIATTAVFSVRQIAKGSDLAESLPADRFATTCGVDGRVFLWNLETGERAGELGNIPADEDMIVAGELAPVPWRLPKVIAVKERMREAEAADVTAKARAEKLAAAAAASAAGRSRPATAQSVTGVASSRDSRSGAGETGHAFLTELADDDSSQDDGGTGLGAGGDDDDTPPVSPKKSAEALAAITATARVSVALSRLKGKEKTAYSGGMVPSDLVARVQPEQLLDGDDEVKLVPGDDGKDTSSAASRDATSAARAIMQSADPANKAAQLLGGPGVAVLAMSGFSAAGSAASSSLAEVAHLLGKHRHVVGLPASSATGIADTTTAHKPKRSLGHSALGAVSGSTAALDVETAIALGAIASELSAARGTPSISVTAKLYRNLNREQQLSVLAPGVSRSDRRAGATEVRDRHIPVPGEPEYDPTAPPPPLKPPAVTIAASPLRKPLVPTAVERLRLGRAAGKDARSPAGAGARPGGGARADVRLEPLPPSASPSHPPAVLARHASVAARATALANELDIIMGGFSTPSAPPTAGTAARGTPITSPRSGVSVDPRDSTDAAATPASTSPRAGPATSTPAPPLTSPRPATLGVASGRVVPHATSVKALDLRSVTSAGAIGGAAASAAAGTAGGASAAIGTIASPGFTTLRSPSFRDTAGTAGTAGGDAGSDAAGPGVARSTSSRGDTERIMPTKFGPYSALEVVKAREIFVACADEYDEAEVRQLCAHRLWQIVFQTRRARDIIDSLAVSEKTAITVQEFFAKVFPMVTPPEIDNMVMWTQPKVANASMKASVHWRDVLSADVIEGLEAIFDAMDTDGSGTVSMLEIKNTLNKNRTTSSGGDSSYQWTIYDIEELVREFDENENAELDKEEFLMMMAQTMHATKGIAVTT